MRNFKKLSGKSTLFRLILLVVAAMPSLLSGASFYFLYNNQEIFTDSGRIQYLFFFVSTFTMAFALTPTTFIAVISGYFFSWPGLPALVVSYMAASVLGLLAGRQLSKRGIRLSDGGNKKLDQLLERLENRQLLFIFFARLSPVLPFAMTNIALSSFSLRWRDYLLGSLAGMLPRTLVFFWTGMNAMDIWAFAQNPNLEGSYKVLPVALILVSVLGLLWVAKKKQLAR
jgi:uncharacterized membrane protein YdjX (TVP38/TMEM64 family)